MARSQQPRKRANGLGSIWWNDKRRRYVGQVTVHAEDGTIKRRTVFGRTQEEIADRLHRLRAEIDGPTLDPSGTPQTSPHLTLSTFLTYWLDNVVPLEGKAQSTLRSYADVVRLYVDPTIGRIPLVELKPADVRRMMTKMTADGKKPNTVRLARTVLRRALRTAMRDELVVRNVAALVDGVNVPRPERSTLTPLQARRFLAYATAQGYGALVTVVLGLGLRRGEALGLRWRDINLERNNPTLTISGILVKDDQGAPLWQPEAKTAGSRRTMHLPVAVVDVLHQHRKAQVAERFAYGPGWAINWPYDDMVFTSPTGHAADPDRITKLIAELSEAAGVGRWTPHGLRHSAASLLIAQGVPLKEISDLLGHSSIRVTADTYGHLMEPSRVAVAEAMQAAIFS